MGEEWKKNADTHKMSSEGVSKAGVEPSMRAPPHQHPGGVLHQRKGLPFGPYTIAVGGFVTVAAISYFSLYVYKKPEASAKDVAKAMTGTAKPEGTHPQK